MVKNPFLSVNWIFNGKVRLVLVTGCTQLEPTVESKKAAVIDQLYTLHPNQIFIDQASGILKKSGFQVDVYRGAEINVDFYGRLPTLGYSVIIFRSHSGIQTGTVHLKDGDKPTRRTYLFTNQPYSESTQVYQQLADRLAKVRVDDNNPWLFGITADYVTRSMQGKFDGAMAIMMGCSTLQIDDLANAFVGKGASAYMGWDASVGLDYVDHSTIALLDRLFLENLPVETAVKETLAEKSTDPTWGARLLYYPDTSGARTLSEMTK